MTQVAHDDGDGIWNVHVKCDGCGAETWDPWDCDPMLWRCMNAGEPGPDYCPACVKERGIEPGWLETAP